MGADKDGQYLNDDIILELDEEYNDENEDTIEMPPPVISDNGNTYFLDSYAIDSKRKAVQKARKRFIKLGMQLKENGVSDDRINELLENDYKVVPCYQNIDGNDYMVLQTMENGMPKIMADNVLQRVKIPMELFEEFLQDLLEEYENYKDIGF